MREQAEQLREPQAAAVHASWMVESAKSVAFGVAVGMFLGLVGAFGTAPYPFFPRMLVFSVIGVGSGLIVAACIALVGRIPSLRGRRLVSRVAVSILIAPLTALWVWAVISWFFLGGFKPEALLIALGYTALLTGPMALLSWLVFRPRVVLSPAGPGPPKFNARLPVKLRGGEIYAVEAEDHYLRLHTSKGSDLILMRLADAIAELEGLEGAQVHRSWWVAKSALADVRRTAGRTVLKLKDGAEAPVSRANVRPLKEAGWF